MTILIIFLFSLQQIANAQKRIERLAEIQTQLIEIKLKRKFNGYLNTISIMF
ncbi:21036_t:CDS:2 [Gigaspora rosea]|nr:21036_t:CDS:2 [Gigaspora rosea]